MPNWFTYQNLKDEYPYKKVQNATTVQQTYINNVLIPIAQDFVKSYTGFDWTDTSVPEDAERVARNFAVNKILADDETVKIAQARGQPSFVVAGDTVNLDLTPGRNPFLSAADEIILGEYQAISKRSLHVDRVTVRSQGLAYDEAKGRGSGSGGDYVRRDGVMYPRSSLRP